jgi:hypothetical protein
MHMKNMEWGVVHLCHSKPILLVFLLAMINDMETYFVIPTHDTTIWSTIIAWDKQQPMHLLVLWELLQVAIVQKIKLLTPNFVEFINHVNILVLKGG